MKNGKIAKVLKKIGAYIYLFFTKFNNTDAPVYTGNVNG